MRVMAEQKREEAYLQYQERQAELNRQHELRMVQLIASLQDRGNHQPSNLVPTTYGNLPIGIHTQHPTQGIQHPNNGQIGLPIMHEQAFPTQSYYSPGTSNGQPVYTDLDNCNN